MLKNPNLRGAVLCRERPEHIAAGITPFCRATQDYHLERGVILLSIPSDPGNATSPLPSEVGDSEYLNADDEKEEVVVIDDEENEQEEEV